METVCNGSKKDKCELRYYNLQPSSKNYEFSYDIRYRVELVYFHLTTELSFIN